MINKIKVIGNKTRSYLCLNLLMFVLIILCFAFGSCKIKKSMTTISVKDSISVREVTKEYYKIDTTYIYLPYESISTTTQEDSSYLTTKYAESWAKVDFDGKLRHKLNTLSTPVEVEYIYKTLDTVRDSIIYRDRISEKKEQIEVRYVPKVYRVSLFISIAYILFTVIIIVARVKRF